MTPVYGVYGALTLLVFFPTLGAIILGFFPRAADRAIKSAALILTAIPLLMSLILFATFDQTVSFVQFVDRLPWVSIGNFNVDYFLGVDGLSMPLVLLTALLFFLAVLISWQIDFRTKEYFILLLVLETGV
ncbi:MAG TPA: NADH-quinone oxidoreductase subunit M, partial [Dehalococcoidia bacterium]|nr:NADH-quinone oxidoreductase subunit M [Dehalococcoidia bacterium]